MSHHRRENDWDVWGEIVNFLFEVIFEGCFGTLVSGLFHFLGFIGTVLFEAISGL